MRLEDYFDVLEPDIIRLKGHRIFLEHIIERWISGYSPEHIAQELPTLELEEVYGTIAYYLHNKAEMDAYLERGRARAEAMMREADAHPDAMTLRIRALKEQRPRML